MRILSYITILFFLPALLLGQNQEHCANHVVLNLVSINFEAGCDFTDFGGIDAAITIFDLNGNILINNEVENLSQVNGPAQNVDFNLSSNPDCCNRGYSQTLGIFPIDELLFDFNVEIYDNDGGCCDGYQSNSDDNYGTDIISIHFVDDVTGTINVGSCISFNYELEVTPIYQYGRMEYMETVCPEFSISFNNIVYDMNNPIGFDTLDSASANGCDSFIRVELDFFELEEVDIVGNEFICQGGSAILGTDGNFGSYEWSNGQTTPEIEIIDPGIYIVEVINDDGCLLEDVIVVDYYPEFFPEVIGIDSLCEGIEATLAVTEQFNSYVWSDGSNTQSIVVDEAGDYTVTVVNSDGCATIADFTIDVLVLSPPNFSGEDLFCFGDSTLISINGDYANYEWSNGANTGSIVVLEGGMYDVTVTSTLGCKAESSIFIEEQIEYVERDTFYTCFPTEVREETSDVFSPAGCLGRLLESTVLYADIPSYDLVEDPFIISGTNVDLYLTLDVPQSSPINWYNLEGELLCGNCDTLQVAPNVTTQYIVELPYHPSCSISDMVEVRVKSSTKIYIPNVFTPDSQDGNQLFEVFGKDVETIDVLNIYDRWGSEIFLGGGNNVQWDGTKAGLEIVNGVYVYYLEVTFRDGVRKTLVGDITLLR